jgi:hypothetical protein
MVATGAVQKHGGLKHKIRGLAGSGVALGVMDDFVGSQVASGAAAGLVGSWVAIGGRGWSLGVAVDLGGSQVIAITCQIFTNAPNFRIK